MSPATAPIPITNSRKRRRSTDKVLNEIAQRGISVQHVANDARQLNANDIGQLQNLIRSNRNRIGHLSFRESIRSTRSTGSTSSNNAIVPESRSSAMSTVFRLFSPGVRVFSPSSRNSQLNANDRTNRSPSIPQNERFVQQSRNINSNSNPNWQFLVGNTTLSELYRCAMASRNQRTTSDASHQNDQIRLIRRIRRRQSTNNTSNHSSR